MVGPDKNSTIEPVPFAVMFAPALLNVAPPASSRMPPLVASSSPWLVSPDGSNSNALPEVFALMTPPAPLTTAKPL